MNKKAVFFSVTALLLVGALLVIMQGAPQRQNADTTVLRIQNMREDVQTLTDTHLFLILKSQSRLALQNMARASISNPSSFSDQEDFTTVFSSCMVDSNCGSDSLTFSISDQLDELSMLYENMQYDAEFTLVKANITQVGNWRLYVQGMFSVTLKERANLASYDSLVPVNAIIDIQGLIDPYTSRELGFTRTFARYLAEEGAWDEERIRVVAAKGMYFSDGDGYSYVERFMSSPEKDSFGLFSLYPAGTYGTSQTSYVDSEGTLDCLVRLPGGQDLYVSDEKAFFFDLTDPSLRTEGCTN